MSGLLETRDQGSEFFNGGSVFRVVDLVGPFVGIPGGVVEFLLVGPVPGVAAEFMADADIGHVRFRFIAQSGDGGAFPRSFRVLEQRDQRASVDAGGRRQSAQFSQGGVDVHQGNEPFRHTPGFGDSRRAKHQ